ncbi:MAG: response regulator transcription factor [Anaerolineae bacterium]
MREPKVKILIVEDDPTACNLVGAAMNEEGYDVVFAFDGQEALQKIYEVHPDLIILDIMLPRVSGWDICQHFRRMSKAPIIMLTAKALESDMVKGLRMGADDYIIKPFSAKELKARVAAQLRHTPEDRHSLTEIHIDENLSINIPKRRVMVRGQECSLTNKEFALLCYLATNTHRIIPQEELLQNIWGWEYIDQADYLRVYIRRLREKIEEDPSNPQYILTERGYGYWLGKPSEKIYERRQDQER